MSGLNSDMKNYWRDQIESAAVKRVSERMSALGCHSIKELNEFVERQISEEIKAVPEVKELTERLNKAVAEFNVAEAKRKAVKEELETLMRTRFGIHMGYYSSPDSLLIDRQISVRHGAYINFKSEALDLLNEYNSILLAGMDVIMRSTAPKGLIDGMVAFLESLGGK